MRGQPRAASACSSSFWGLSRTGLGFLEPAIFRLKEGAGWVRGASGPHSNPKRPAR